MNLDNYPKIHYTFPCCIFVGRCFSMRWCAADLRNQRTWSERHQNPRNRKHQTQRLQPRRKDLALVVVCY